MTKENLNEIISAREDLAALAKAITVSDACLGSNMQEHVSGLYALEHLRIHGTVTGRLSSKQKFLSVPKTPKIPMPPTLPDRRAAIQHTRRKYARGECS